MYTSKTLKKILFAFYSAFLSVFTDINLHTIMCLESFHRLSVRSRWVIVLFSNFQETSSSKSFTKLFYKRVEQYVLSIFFYSKNLTHKIVIVQSFRSIYVYLIFFVSFKAWWYTWNITVLNIEFKLFFIWFENHTIPINPHSK